MANVNSSDESECHLLPQIVAVSCAIILEDAIDELTIIRKMSPFSGMAIDSRRYQSTETNISNYIPETQLFDFETIAPIDEALAREEYLKYHRDSHYLEEICTETMLALIKTRRYDFLKKQVDQYFANEKFENDVFQKYDTRKKSIDRLEASIKTEKVQNKMLSQKLDKAIGDLKDRIEELTMEQKIKLKYVKDWEESRLDQNDSQLDYAERAYMKIINHYKNDIDKEMRISAEIESFILEVQQDHTQSIQQWMERYDAEIEVRDMEIQIMKGNRETQLDRIQKLSELFEIHRVEIEEYLVEREKIRQNEEIKQTQLKAAIKIQAWWRGVMVRKGFGQFKKEVAKKKGKKKKSK
ncbi:hypothetical protein FQA39_LY07825 [Lamprigera yunnana]|nr:hypothetical protein FQA39_LY07825 [Lamprigera yunnana]